MGSIPQQFVIDAMTAVYGVSTFCLSFLQFLPKFKSQQITAIEKWNGHHPNQQIYVFSTVSTELSYSLEAAVWIFYTSDEKGTDGSGALKLGCWLSQDSKPSTQEIPLLID